MVSRLGLIRSSTRGAHCSGRIRPRSAASKIRAPQPPGFIRGGRPGSMAKAISEPTVAMAAEVRGLSGPRASKAAAPQSSMWSRPSCGRPTSSRTMVSGKTCDRSETASNEPRSTRPATIWSAVAWISSRTSRSAPGPSGPPSASRNASCVGGSEATMVPRMPPLAGMLSPGPPAEEKASWSARAALTSA